MIFAAQIFGAAEDGQNADADDEHAEEGAEGIDDQHVVKGCAGVGGGGGEERGGEADDREGREDAGFGFAAGENGFEEHDQDAGQGEDDFRQEAEVLGIGGHHA